MTATYLDGWPTNLEAAANDALEWLKLLQRFGDAEMHEAQKAQLKRAATSIELREAIKALEKFLPKDEHVFEATT